MAETKTFDPTGAIDEAYKLSLIHSPAELAGYLLEEVGPRITAAGLGQADARPVKSWAKGEGGPKEHAVADRLLVLFRVVYEISKAYSPATAAGFLRSSNPQLDDASPLIVLADGDPDEVGPVVLAAARAFLEG